MRGYPTLHLAAPRCGTVFAHGALATGAEPAKDLRTILRPVSQRRRRMMMTGRSACGALIDNEKTDKPIRIKC
jgi:hypothetical protein